MSLHKAGIVSLKRRLYVAYLNLPDSALDMLPDAEVKWMYALSLDADIQAILENSRFEPVKGEK